VIDHNLYYCASGPSASTWGGASGRVSGFDKYVESTGSDTHSQFIDPKFVNPAVHDFHLQSGSPAVDFGRTDGLPVGEFDLDHFPRMKAGKIDLGCYQAR